jgi:hypothetical protein
MAFYKKKSSKKGPVRSKKVTFDGINFASGLEKYMYIALKKAKIKFEYEPRTYQLLDTFQFESSAIERQSNGKGEFKDRGNKKILGIKYTPDFEGDSWTVETKGRANESFPIRYKLFKNWIQNNDPGRLLLKPQNQKECDEAIQIILKKENNNERNRS